MRRAAALLIPAVAVAAWLLWPRATPWHHVLIPAGTTTLGSPASELGHDAGEEQRSFTVLEPLRMSATEVPQGLYRELMGALPDCHGEPAERGDDLPVVCVDRADAFAFCAALSARDGLPPDRGWRLPSEQEWEYAARAGGADVFAGTSAPNQVCRYANLGDGLGCDDGYEGLAPVGSFAPNAWGLYDMTGNAMEWTDTVWDPPPGEVAPTPELRWVERGGSWVDGAPTAGVADRGWGPGGRRLNTLGFRVVRPAP
jgi:sulfatase modifying factor 1